MLITCRACRTDVPVGAFCTLCGARQALPHGTRRRDRWRINAYAAAPGEHLLWPSVVSSLFPHLPHRSRTAFRVGLVALMLVLAALAVMRCQTLLIAVAALGLPLIFQVYLQESGVYDDLPGRLLISTAALGVALGLGWALLTGPIVARSFIVAIGVTASTVQRTLDEGLAIPLVGAVLMLLPAVAARMLRPLTRESLDGFLSGSLGAIGFTAAATVTRLAPLLQIGGLTSNRTAGALLIEAAIEGVAVPLTAAATGGLVGAALWFTRREDARPARQWPAPIPLMLSVAVVLALYAGLGLVDVATWLPAVQAGLHLMIAAVAVLALRIGLHAALLREAQADRADEVLLCAQCSHLVASTTFCPHCGIAVRASSLSSRAARRAPASHTHYEVIAPTAHHTSPSRLLRILGVSLAPALVAVMGVAGLITPSPRPIHCPPHCGGPPLGTRSSPGGLALPARLPPGSAGERVAQPTRQTRPGIGPSIPPGPPVLTFQRFTPEDGTFSVDYDTRGGAKVTLNPTADIVSLVYGRDVGAATLFGEPAHGRTPRQIARGLINAYFPGASTDYEIPNALVGYQPGYGEIDDFVPASSTSSSTPLRVLVMVAMKHGFALIATADGPALDPKRAPSGHPSGANLFTAGIIGDFVNRFTWQGDPPR
jgi:hypothetical protein